MMDYRPSPAVAFLIIIIVVVLTIAIVLFGNFGSGYKVSIGCQVKYTIDGTFSFALEHPIVDYDNTVIATNPMWEGGWPWDTGVMSMRATIENFEPEGFDAQIHGGTAEVDLGHTSSIIGGLSKEGTLELRHLTPGEYTVSFEVLEKKGWFGTEEDVKKTETFTITVAENSASGSWENGAWY